jgi:hypothetical protein
MLRHVVDGEKIPKRYRNAMSNSPGESAHILRRHRPEERATVGLEATSWEKPDAELLRNA